MLSCYQYLIFKYFIIIFVWLLSDIKYDVMFFVVSDGGNGEVRHWRPVTDHPEYIRSHRSGEFPGRLHPGYHHQTEVVA